MKKKIGFFVLSFVVIAIGYLVFTSIDGSNKIEPVKIGYSGHSLNYAALMVAHELDLFTKNGVAVELVPFKSGSETRLALATGKIGVALLSLSNVLVGVDSKLPYKILGPSASVSTAVYVRPDNEIESFEDLKGKKIIGEDGTSRLEFLKVIENEGLKKEDVTFLDIDRDYKEVALMEQKIVDALPTSRYKEDSFIKAGAVKFKAWEDKGYGGIFNPHTFVAVNTTYAISHYDELEKVILALSESEKMILNKPTEVAPLVVAHVKKNTDGVAIYTPEQILKSWRDSVHFLMWVDPNYVMENANYLYELGELKNRLTINQIFDMHFEQELKTLQVEIYGKEI